LCLGQRLTGEDLAKAIMDSFLSGQPDLSERHTRRVHKLEEPCQI
jgi:ribose 5-phosphate isomerase RpiB